MSQDVRFARVIAAAPEVVFDAFTVQDGQQAFYGEPGWIVESACDLRVGGIWTVTFGHEDRWGRCFDNLERALQ